MYLPDGKNKLTGNNLFRPVKAGRIFFKQENRMSGKKSKNAVHFFVDYVKERNVSLITKAEWEQLYFYCTSKNRRLKR